MKILLTEPLIESVDDAGLCILEKAGTVKIARSTSEGILIEEAEDADAIVVRLAKITSRIIEKADKLKVIARTGIGVDNIDVAAATKKRVMVVNLPSMNTDSVAEHVMCLILASAKNLIAFNSEVRRGNWRIRDQLLPNNIDLLGKTLGIIGAGKIGYAVARRALGFDMKILFYDVISRPEMGRLGAKSTDLDILLKQADFVTVHVPLIKETHHLINEGKLGLMKKSAYLVNASRGEVVDQKALYNALDGKIIAGAALDVFEDEPPESNDPILRLGNVILTPHVAGHTGDSRRKMIIALAEDVSRALSGETPVNLVNRELLR